MTAISLREAAKQLRHRGAGIRATGESEMDLDLQAYGDSWCALATLLDGDGEGGLLGRRDFLAKQATDPWVAQYSEFSRTIARRRDELEMALTLVAAYVSAVLGTTVEA